MRPADLASPSSGLAAAGAFLATCVADGQLPSAVLEVGHAAGIGGRVACGAADDATYDLASLTKVLATGLVATHLVATRQLDLDTPVRTCVPGWHLPDRADVRLRDLLAHASGLPAHLPLYERHAGTDAIVTASAAAPLVAPPRATAIYSDLGFIVLGRALETLGSDPLEVQTAAILRRVSDAPPAFGPVDTTPAVQSTGRSAWRGRLRCGDVHDDNAAAMGGVAGHAGLFGTAGGVGDVARAVLRGLRADDTALAPAWAVRAFARRSPVPGSSRALAWDTALPTSSCGRHLSARAIGHTGFTGTSIWIDPERDCYVVLLTNRVAGTATLADMAVIRRTVHDLVASGGRRV